jgi:hypothetical protein
MLRRKAVDMKKQPESKSLFLKDLLRSVHRELLESEREREKEGLAPLFIVRDMTVEVNFVVTETTKGEGKEDFKVITAGGSTQYLEQQVQKITLHLDSVRPGVPGPAVRAGLRSGPARALGGLPRGGAPFGPERKK